MSDPYANESHQKWVAKETQARIKELGGEDAPSE